MSICVSVCLSTFEVPFNGLFSPTSQSRMSNIEIRNPWGKVMERSGLTLEFFLFGSGLKLPRTKKVFFFADFALQNMLETTLLDGLETSAQRVYH